MEFTSSKHWAPFDFFFEHSLGPQGTDYPSQIVLCDCNLWIVSPWLKQLCKGFMRAYRGGGGVGGQNKPNSSADQKKKLIFLAFFKFKPS